MNALHHVVYTNAAGSDGRGFRFVYRAPAWPVSDRRRLEGWLRGLDVADAATPTGTCAVNSLRLAGTIHACLVSADGGFGTDAHGRPARLIHAVLTPLDERAPAPDWGSALLARRRAFARPAAPPDVRLDTYMKRCEGERGWPLDAATPSCGKASDHDVNDDIASRVLSGAASGASELPMNPADDMPALLISVTASLPPRLRLAFRWSLGVGRVKGATMIRISQTPIALGPDPRAVAYAGWVRRSGDRSSSTDVSLATDWRIRSWNELMTATMSS